MSGLASAGLLDEFAFLPESKFSYALIELVDQPLIGIRMRYILLELVVRSDGVRAWCILRKS